MQKRRQSKYAQYIPKIRELRPTLKWKDVVKFLGLNPEEYGAIRAMMHRVDKKDIERLLR